MKTGTKKKALALVREISDKAMDLHDLFDYLAEQIYELASRFGSELTEND